MRVTLGPSILTADFLHLERAVHEAESAGVDFLHLDIMDGQFVPNITFGPFVVAALRKTTPLPLDVHLMVQTPEKHIASFIDAGADGITVHAEACQHLHGVLMSIRTTGAAAGVAINPGTAPESVAEVLHVADQLLVMSVNPGFGGQSFLPTSISKITRSRELIEQSGAQVIIAVDGGVKPSNVGKVVAAGASMIVAGSAIYSPEVTVAEGVHALLAGIDAVVAQTGGQQ